MVWTAGASEAQTCWPGGSQVGSEDVLKQGTLTSPPDETHETHAGMERLGFKSVAGTTMAVPGEADDASWMVPLESAGMLHSVEVRHVVNELPGVPSAVSQLTM